MVASPTVPVPAPAVPSTAYNTPAPAFPAYPGYNPYMPSLGWSTGVPGGSWPYTSNQGGGLPNAGFPSAKDAFATSQGPASLSPAYWSSWPDTAHTQVPAQGAQGISQSIADSSFDSANGLQSITYAPQASWPDWPNWQTEPTSMSSMAHTSQTEAASTPSTI